MASQIAHIVYAKRYLKKHPMPEVDQEQFLLGSVFPDIRRVAPDMKRDKTHQAFDKIDLDFENLTSFESGWKFHLYCDMKREEILRNKNFYALKKDQSEKWLHPAKLLEDELLYDQYNNWEKLVSYFNHPPKIDTGLKIDRESFNLWYAMVARYFEKKPDKKAMHIFLMKQHGLPDKVDNIVEGVENLKKNEEAVEIINNLASEIISLQ